MNYVDFWKSKLGGLKDMVKTAYNKATAPDTTRLISPLGAQPTPTTQAIPAAQVTPTTAPPQAIPTLSPNFAFTTQGKPEVPRELIDTINTASVNAGIDPRVVSSLAAQETGGYGYQPVPGASGERGITQIIPKWYYKEAGYRTPEEYGQALESSNEFAIKETARILKKNYTARKSIFDALREYNAGPTLMGGTEYAIQVLRRVGLEDEIPEEYKDIKGAKE